MKVKNKQKQMYKKDKQKLIIKINKSDQNIKKACNFIKVAKTLLN